MRLTSLLTLLVSITTLWTTNASAIDFAEKPNEHSAFSEVINVAVYSSLSPELDHTVSEQFQGININYLQSIAQELNASLNIEGYGKIENVYKALENGEADVAVGFSRTPSREQRFVFSDTFYKTSLAVWYRNNRTAYLAPQSLKWVCLRESSYCSRLQSLGVVNPSVVDDFDQSFEMVNSGEADAFVANYVSLLQYLNENDIVDGQVWVPDWLEPEQVSVMAAPSKQALITRINDVLASRGESLRAYSSQSFNAYHKIDQANIAYRNSHLKDRSVRFTFNEDSYPLFYRDSDGKLTGALNEMLRLIQSRSGIKFHYVPTPEGKTPDQMIEDGEIDILPMVFKDGLNSTEIKLTDAYMNMKYVGVELSSPRLSKDQPDGVLMTTRHPSELGVTHSTFSPQTRPYTDLTKMLNALRNGEISRAYIRDDLVDMMLGSGHDDQFKINRKDFKMVHASIGVSKQEPLLLNALNSVLATVDDNELKKIRDGYSHIKVVYGYDKFKVALLTGSLILVALIIILISYLFSKNLKLQVVMRENEAKNSQNEFEFMQRIINALPLQIFIHDSNHNLVLSNCENYISGACKGCSMAENNSSKAAIVENHEVLEKVLNDDYSMARTVDITDCSLNIQTVDFFRKRVIHSATQKAFALTAIHDVSRRNQQQRELIEANKLAEQAVVARERFLASMSHELRTPIAGMSGLLEMLNMRLTHAEDRMLLKNVITSTQNLKMLVNDILDFSKLEANQLNIEAMDFNVMKGTCELLRIHSAAAKDKELEFEFNWTPSAIRIIKIDALRYSQIVNNLLSNAIKFTDSGKIRVDTRVTEQNIHFSVMDSGVGMTEQQQKIVFQPFVQADNTIARRYGGTGLGLTIVRDLIELMGGEFELESVTGLGTKITFTLPLEVVECYNNLFPNLELHHGPVPKHVMEWMEPWFEHVEFAEQRHSLFLTTAMDQSRHNEDYTVVLDPAVTQMAEVDDNIIRLSTTPLFPDVLFEVMRRINDGDTEPESDDIVMLSGHVLVAEDNPINQMLIAKQLEEMGVTVDLVSDGLQALNRLRRNITSYDLLITDGHMPNMDGYQLARRVRDTLPEFADKPIIGCTAEDSRVALQRAETSGFDHILYKPYGIYPLNQLLKKFLPAQANVTAQVRPQAIVTKLCWLDNFQEQEARMLGDVYITTMQEDCEKLIEVKNDLAQVRQVAHRIKGGAGTVGLKELMELAQTVEDAAAEGHQDIHGSINSLITQITETIEHTRDWLNAHEHTVTCTDS
ncbi:ATP-binding protein [Vibrio olivae]|uniref:histidine kinase n=1 Tax=Vibrio olivae TaxID=1243002 RepID=A0ABV5HQ55_9VIBR